MATVTVKVQIDEDRLAEADRYVNALQGSLGR